jgi:UDP:flavonoid glycosyltransferase YjiC (YdhE family)
MARIGLLTLGVPGHWNPTSCLAHALQSRGNAVTAFQLTYYEEVVRRSGVDYCPIGVQVYPRSRMEKIYAHLGTLQGGALLRYTISIFTERSQMYLVEAPELLRLAGIELVLVDQFEPAGHASQKSSVSLLSRSPMRWWQAKNRVSRRSSQPGLIRRISPRRFETKWRTGSWQD